MPQFEDLTVRGWRRRWLRIAGLTVTDSTVTLADGGVLTSGGEGSGDPADRVSNPGLATVSGLANGDAWVEASGTTPNRLISLKVRDGGVTYTLAEIEV